MIKFYDLKRDNYNSFMKIINDFSKKYELKNSGVLILALENLPEIYEKLICLTDYKYYFNDLEIYSIIKEYNEINYSYTNYFNQIFERCCGYESVKTDLNFYLGSVYKWTEVVMNIPESIYDAYYNKTINLNTNESSKIYSEILKLGNETLFDLLKRVYRSY